MMKIVESFTGFQPLEEIWIGGVYPQKFYNHLPQQVQDSFGKITEVTNKAFDDLEKKLVELGVKVRKPEFTDRVDDYMDHFDNLIKPPVAPRDWIITIGNEMWIICQGYKVEPYAHVIDEYWLNGEAVKIIPRGADPESWLIFPGIVRLSNRIIVDPGANIVPGSKHENKIKEAISSLEKKYEVIPANGGGHLDSVFCPIKKGQIFSSHWGSDEMYKRTLPDWEVFYIQAERSPMPDKSWWTPDNHFISPIFNKHIEQNASDWVGDSRETVFEANMLVVDEKNVICIAENDHSFKKLETLGITPHVVDFPARFFWDGGPHCITVDIRRTGGCVDYFN